MATALDGLAIRGSCFRRRRRKHIKHVARLIVHAVVHYNAHTPCCTCVNKKGAETTTLSAAATAFLVIIFNSSINFFTHIKKETTRARGGEIKRINTFRLIYVDRGPQQGRARVYPTDGAHEKLPSSSRPAPHHPHLAWTQWATNGRDERQATRTHFQTHSHADAHFHFHVHVHNHYYGWRWQHCFCLVTLLVIPLLEFKPFGCLLLLQWSWVITDVCACVGHRHATCHCYTRTLTRPPYCILICHNFARSLPN